jgi:hypothetical protein
MHRTGNLSLRELYKHLLQPHQFPTSAKYWKALAQLEIADGDTPAVEAVFEKCLPLVSAATSTCKTLLPLCYQQVMHIHSHSVCQYDQYLQQASALMQCGTISL